MDFYVGLHHPSDAHRFERAFVSVNVLRRRKKPVGAKSWIMDSGAFTELALHGRYRTSVKQYADEINRWANDPNLVAVVAQDYMCEPFIIAKTGLSIKAHQRLTIERYDLLLKLVDRRVQVMPVLQGYTVADYIRHLKMYGDRLKLGTYVGVGSICKRNAHVGVIEDILVAIKQGRPDLRLHGFGLKSTALASSVVRKCLFSADSMAWSFAARRQGRNPNDWQEAKQFADRITQEPSQRSLFDALVP